MENSINNAMINMPSLKNKTNKRNNKKILLFGSNKTASWYIFVSIFTRIASNKYEM